MIDRLLNLFHRRRRDQELDAELRYHIESLEDEHKARGLAPDEARLAAQRDFGGIVRTREAYREQRGLPFLDTLWQDLRYCFRSLRRTPTMTLAVIATFALGIGANTALFGIIDAVLLDPLPYRDPDRLVWITQETTVAPRGFLSQRDTTSLVTADLLEWSNARTIDAVASFSLGEARVTNDREAWYPRVARSSEPLGQILGVAPVLGRDFLPEDLEPGAAGVALLSDRTFRQRFGTDPGAIGASIRFRDVFTNVPYTVIGVMPDGFRLPLPPEGQAPLEADLIVNRAVDPASLFSGSAVARLSAGASLEAARAELNAIMQANDDEGRTPSEILDRRLQLEPLHERVVGSSRFPLLVMWAAVAFVLMIACVNVANLLLARSAARSREVAIRTALGAGRLRLLRQQLTESVALALAGGIAGVGLAVLGLDALLDWMPLEIPRLRDAAVDESVLAFTVAVSAITGMVSGMASAWTASGTRPVATLANGALAGSRGRNRLHGWLVVSELALAMVLTLGAGLMVRSLWLIDAGIEEFALDRVVAARYETSPPTQLGEMDGPRFTDAERGAAAVARANEGQRYDAETVARIEALPGVSAAAIWAQTTASGESLVRGPRGVARVDGSELGPSEIANVTPHYFAAAGMRLVAGRLFTEEDGQFGGPRIVIVNEAFLRPYELDPVSALGMELDGPAAQRIVGVVSDFRTRPDQPVRPQVFTPHSGGLIIANGYVWVRASGDPMAFEGQIRRILTRNGTTRMAEGETVADQMSASIAPRRFQGVLLISFAAMALALALVGTYGVLNYAVAERTREIGVRMALGATRRTVMGTVLGRGLAFGVTGIVIGIVGALALTQLIESLLYGVRPTDMWTYAAVSLIMLAVALAAAFLPAWRATRVDPINALRYE